MMEFKKSTGQTPGGPGAWIQRNLPLCPMCKHRSEWETAIGFALSLKRYYFRCSNCHAILSAPAADVVAVAPTPINLAIKPAPRLVRIEDVGQNEALEHLAGREYGLLELQDWARET